MTIAFDAKRAFHNARGLGNYSRDTIRLLSSFYPENNYLLFNPKDKKNILFPLAENTKEILPDSFLGKSFPSIWRSKGMCHQIRSSAVDIYHGLSQELPWGIKNTGARTVVTMHDAIFMRYPELYSSVYRAIFIQKNKYACRVADRIIAISEQTKRDIIKYFDADENKISVVYQGCNNIFRVPVSDHAKELIRKKYNLPECFLLNVGAIEKRKNVALIIEAMQRKHIDAHLVVVGKPDSSYFEEVSELISRYGLESQVHFIHNAMTADLPAIYSLSEMFIYPSVFEGFGIPILEALCTGTPVISSLGSCFEETGGPNSRYINPENADELGEAILEVLNDSLLRKEMKLKGLEFSEQFTDQRVAQNLMNVYQSF
jgi:glycosyltransferase involved in cell wall biosynthesis